VNWLRLLRRREYAMWWSGQTLSLWGNLAYTVGLPLWILGRTGSATSMGIAFFLQMLPSLLFGPWAGALVDRWDRKATAVACDIIRCLLLLALALGGAESPIWFTYVMAFVISLVGVLFRTARHPLTVALVGKQDLAWANAMWQFSVASSIMVGPFLGGLLTAAYSPVAALLFDAVTFLVAGILLAAAPLPRTVTVDESEHGGDAERREGLLREFLAAACLTRRHPLLARLAVVEFLYMLASGCGSVLTYAYFQSRWGLSAAWIGVLLLCQGTGMILSSVWGGRLLQRHGEGRALRLGLLFEAGCAPLSVNLIFIHTGLTAAAMVAVGSGMALYRVAADTLVQQAAPRRYLGRIAALMNLLSSLGLGVSTVIGGVLSDWLGPWQAWNIMVAFALVIAVGAALSLRRFSVVREADGVSPTPDSSATAL